MDDGTIRAGHSKYLAYLGFTTQKKNEFIEEKVEDTESLILKIELTLTERVDTLGLCYLKPTFQINRSLPVGDETENNNTLPQIKRYSFDKKE